jgi:Long-chain acyl-CoA synthetases (AMP-forming)
MRRGGKRCRALEIEITKDLTIPKQLVRTAKEYGDRKVAMREKEFGIWRSYTWADYLERVKALALGFHRLGLRRGDKVALIGDNRPEGLWSEMATLCVGGIAVWLYQDSLPEEIAYIVDHSDARFVVCETQEEVDKILAIRDRCPKVEWIFWDDPKGMRHYRDPMLMPLTEVMRLGREVAQEHPGLFEELVEQGHGDDIALLFYTSGTTGKPKGALLSHYNLLKMGQNLMRVDPYYEDDEFVSFLPFAWIGEQMMSVSSGILAGFTLNFPEEPETAWHDLREIAPHIIFSPPRVWEQMVRTIQVLHADSPWLKRKVFELGMAIGYRLADRKFAKQKPTPLERLLGWLAYWIVFRPVRDRLGLSRTRYAYTGGAAMGPDHFRFYHALGVNLKQIYGQTEISGISVLHRDGDIKFDTVGKPIPETEVRISPEGEILSRSPSVFRGYYKNPEATAEALRDGWLHSGDRGFIDEDGHLVVFDRSKDVMILRDGRPFSPQYIETRLKFSPYIKDAWVIGHELPYVTAVICIDYNVVGKWAEARRIPYTSYQELSQKPEVYDLVASQVRQVNRSLPEPARIVRFVNLFKEFDADDQELTRTRKLRRAFLMQRYRPIVQALYDPSAREVHFETTITYEDGTMNHVRADLRIVDLEPVPAAIPVEGTPIPVPQQAEE